MPSRRRSAAMLSALLILSAASVRAQHEHAADMPGMSAAPAAGALPLYTNLGTWTHPVTATPAAQKYFDQGLRLYYGFNHEEAILAFREAARLDPACPMAWWGVAVSAGPNINLPMDDDHAKVALDAIGRARALASRGSAEERDWIAALAQRYSADASASRTGLDSAYATAMGDMARKYPDDVDAQVLHAESMLDLNPWNQWAHDGQPNPGTLEIVAILERELQRHPLHPGANHFYIHTVEASPHPERALEAAKRLETLEPGAGHLVHMPSHIYARTGRYEDARATNRKAMGVDEKYIAERNPQGAYPLMYYTHNIQFVWFTSCMEGDATQALAAARRIEERLPPDVFRQMSMLEMASPYPIMTLARFGRWDEVLAEPAPPADLRFASAIWHYARGLARAGKGDGAAAHTELDSVLAISSLVPLEQSESINFARPILRLASHALTGEIARRAKDPAVARAEFTAAVAAEDSLHYDEPPTWYYPVRHMLGATLLESGKAAEAEAVYREDLERHPGNGWSLRGLEQAQRAAGHAHDADQTLALLRKAWAHADVTPRSSAF